MKTYAVFTENISENIDTIQNIRNYLKQKYDSDFVVFSDNINTISDCSLGILPSFYMRYFQGTTIFLDTLNYLENKNNMLNEPYLYATDKIELPQDSNVFILS